MKPLPNIGFDRFIARSWLDMALAIAAGQRDRAELTALLELDIKGVEARSKTSIILNRMWLAPHPTLAVYAADGIALFNADPGINTLALHWGMALQSHPLFASIVDAIGRLLKLHGEFTSAQVIRRLKEQYGDRASVVRAAEAVLQTMVGWEIIRLEDVKVRRFVGQATLQVDTENTAFWLIDGVIGASGKSVSLMAQYQWLFPWSLPVLSDEQIGKSSTLIAQRSGDGAVWLTSRRAQQIS